MKKGLLILAALLGRLCLAGDIAACLKTAAAEYHGVGEERPPCENVILATLWTEHPGTLQDWRKHREEILREGLRPTEEGLHVFIEKRGPNGALTAFSYLARHFDLILDTFRDGGYLLVEEPFLLELPPRPDKFQAANSGYVSAYLSLEVKVKGWKTERTVKLEPDSVSIDWMGAPNNGDVGGNSSSGGGK